MTREFRFYTREHAEEQMAHYRAARTTHGSKALCRELKRYAELGDAYPFKRDEVRRKYDERHLA